MFLWNYDNYNDCTSHLSYYCLYYCCVCCRWQECHNGWHRGSTWRQGNHHSESILFEAVHSYRVHVSPCSLGPSRVCNMQNPFAWTVFNTLTTYVLFCGIQPFLETFYFCTRIEFSTIIKVQSNQLSCNALISLVLLR